MNYKIKLNKVITTIFILFILINCAIADDGQSNTKFAIFNLCHPSIDESLPQHIIGYGSLMDSKSKRKTTPDAGDNIPINVKGFKRGWILQVPDISTATYLAVIPKKNKKMNAVMYRVYNPKAIISTDRREITYCRMRVVQADIEMLDGSPKPNGQVWIYTMQQDKAKKPTEKLPLIQSYIDIVMKGCLEIEEKFKLKDFAKNFVLTTSNWSKYWINDRLFPRAALLIQPKAKEIDTVLYQNIPQFLQHRKIE